MGFIGDEIALPPPSQMRAVINLEPLSPMVGKPNPELERVSGPQKLFLLFMAVGIIVLVGLPYG